MKGAVCSKWSSWRKIGFFNTGMTSIPPRPTQVQANHKHPQAQLLLRARCERKDVDGRGDPQPQTATNLQRAREVSAGDPTKKRYLVVWGIFIASWNKS